MFFAFGPHLFALRFGSCKVSLPSKTDESLENLQFRDRREREAWTNMEQGCWWINFFTSMLVLAGIYLFPQCAAHLSLCWAWLSPCFGETRTLLLRCGVGHVRVSCPVDRSLRVAVFVTRVEHERMDVDSEAKAE